MTRETRGGSFGEVLGTGVHQNEWWFLRVADVHLEGDGTSVHALCDANSGERMDQATVRRALPIGLAMSSDQELPVGMIATRVYVTGADRLDVAYPFILTDDEGAVVLAFGTPGPKPSVRAEIVTACAERLAWALRSMERK